MVAKNQKKKVVVKDDDSDKSFDDMSEEELKKMLGNSDNSDFESDDFSEEEEVVSKEAKPNKKRKHESDDESDDQTSKKKKIVLHGDDEDFESDDDDDDDEEDDDVDMEGSFIDDDEDEEDEVKKPIKIKTDKKEKTEMKTKVEKKKIKVEQPENEEYKKMFEDTPTVESASLRKEIEKRIFNRKNQTFVLLNLPYKFDNAQAKALVPELVSVIIPYDCRMHQIKGKAYIDVSSAELAAKYVKDLKGFKMKNRKLTAFPINKRNENIDDFNCTRLALSNLSSKIDIDSLKSVFPKATLINMLPTKSNDKCNTRVAFAQYATVEEAIQDMDDKHGTVIKGFPVHVKFQAKSNTNIKKPSLFDKKTIEVMGLSKSVKDTDLKKLFPQATQILYLSGNQHGLVRYENETDCKVDYDNFIKNKPAKSSMKIFYKRVSNPKQASPVDKKQKSQSSNETNEKVNGKKEFSTMNVKFEKRNKKENKSPKTKFDNKKKQPSGEGVKKNPLKPSKNKNFKKEKKDFETLKTIQKPNNFSQELKKSLNTNFHKDNSTMVSKGQKPNVSNAKPNNHNKIKGDVMDSVKPTNGKPKELSIKTGKTEGKLVTTSISPKHVQATVVRNLKAEKRKHKKEKKNNLDLIDKRKQEKKAKKLLKKKMRKQARISE